jgi:hypothetical protein
MKSNKITPPTKVRLTESKLRSIIQESVRKAINELDARTYASAANKLSHRGWDLPTISDMDRNDGRVYALRDAAANAWNKKYGNNGARMATNREITDIENGNNASNTHYHTYIPSDSGFRKGHPAENGLFRNDSYLPDENFYNYTSNYLPGRKTDRFKGDYNVSDRNFDTTNVIDKSSPYYSAGRLKSKVSPEGFKLANQMATGKGYKYIPGQGYIDDDTNINEPNPHDFDDPNDEFDPHMY